VWCARNPHGRIRVDGKTKRRSMFPTTVNLRRTGIEVRSIDIMLSALPRQKAYHVGRFRTLDCLFGKRWDTNLRHKHLLERHPAAAWSYRKSAQPGFDDLAGNRLATELRSDVLNEECQALRNRNTPTSIANHSGHWGNIRRCERGKHNARLYRKSTCRENGYGERAIQGCCFEKLFSVHKKRRKSVIHNVPGTGKIVGKRRKRRSSANSCERVFQQPQGDYHYLSHLDCEG